MHPGTKAPASSLHSKVEPGSVAVKVNVAVVSDVGSVGFEMMEVSGATVSETVMVVSAPVPSFVAASLHFTWAVCGPVDV